MKKKKIMLSSVNDAKAFVEAAGKCDFDVDIYYNSMMIDAKSILGVLSMDLSRVLTVQLHGDDETFEAFLDRLAAKNSSAA